MWLTETGWATPGNDECWFDVEDEGSQGQHYGELLPALAASPLIERSFFYELVDDPGYAPCQWGALRPDLSEKPAFAAVRSCLAP